MQKIETQKAADQAVLETKTLLKSLSVSKAAYSKIYFRLKRLPTDASSPKKKNIYIYLSGKVATSSTTVPLGGFWLGEVSVKKRVLIRLLTIMKVSLMSAVPDSFREAITALMALISVSLTSSSWPSPTPSR